MLWRRFLCRVVRQGKDVVAGLMAKMHAGGANLLVVDAMCDEDLECIVACCAERPSSPAILWQCWACRCIGCGDGFGRGYGI